MGKPKENPLREAVREARATVNEGAEALRAARGGGVANVAAPLVREATETVREVRGLVDATADLGRDVLGAVDEARSLWRRLTGPRVAAPVPPPPPSVAPEARLPPVRVDVKLNR